MSNPKWNIPNLLSLYRLLAFPVILVIALKGMEDWFVTLLVINLITDILDGFIARQFNMQTEFGARLDSIADIGTYILAIIGVFVFKYNDFEPHLFSFGVFLILYVGLHLLSLLKFKRFSSFHLYSSKIAGYIQGVFFFVLFTVDFYSWFYYFMVIFSMLSFIEHIIIQLILPETRSNQKGLYWVLKSK